MLLLLLIYIYPYMHEASAMALPGRPPIFHRASFVPPFILALRGLYGQGFRDSGPLARPIEEQPLYFLSPNYNTHMIYIRVETSTSSIKVTVI